MADLFYGTAAGFVAYWEARGNTTLANIDEDQIGPALLIASEWLDAAFIENFEGLKVDGREQEREWPRTGVFDIYGYTVPSSAVPREIVQAVYEAAARQITTPGVFFKDYTPSKYKSVSVSGAISVEYATGSAYDFQTGFPAIAAKLHPIIGARGAQSVSSLSGASSRV